MRPAGEKLLSTNYLKAAVEPYSLNATRLILRSANTNDITNDFVNFRHGKENEVETRMI